MSEDLNLPASLQRLEITPERAEGGKTEDNPFSVPSLPSPSQEEQPECSLENLSLKAVCSKGNCLCNRKKDNKEEDEVLRKVRRSGGGRRPVLRRSRLVAPLLRAPLLKLSDHQQAVASLSELAALSSEGSSRLDSHLLPLKRKGEDGCGEGTERLTGRSLLRAPVLRVDSSRPPPHRLHVRSRGEGERSGEDRQEGQSQRQPSMCAVQARNPSPDDTNIEELASYFDLFVHIPKKMSVMAEMMYI